MSRKEAPALLQNECKYNCSLYQNFPTSSSESKLTFPGMRASKWRKRRSGCAIKDRCCEPKRTTFQPWITFQASINQSNEKGVPPSFSRGISSTTPRMMGLHPLFPSIKGIKNGSHETIDRRTSTGKSNRSLAMLACASRENEIWFQMAVGQNKKASSTLKQMWGLAGTGLSCGKNVMKDPSLPEKMDRCSLIYYTFTILLLWLWRSMLIEGSGWFKSCQDRHQNALILTEITQNGLR